MSTEGPLHAHDRYDLLVVVNTRARRVRNGAVLGEPQERAGVGEPAVMGAAWVSGCDAESATWRRKEEKEKRKKRKKRKKDILVDSTVEALILAEGAVVVRELGTHRVTGDHDSAELRVA